MGLQFIRRWMLSYILCLLALWILIQINVPLQMLHVWNVLLKLLYLFLFVIFVTLQAGKWGVPGPGQLMALLICLFQQALLYCSGLWWGSWCFPTGNRLHDHRALLQVALLNVFYTSAPVCTSLFGHNIDCAGGIMLYIPLICTRRLKESLLICHTHSHGLKINWLLHVGGQRSQVKVTVSY